MRWCALLCLLALGGGAGRRPICYSDLPVKARNTLGTSAEGFAEFVRSIERWTAERLAVRFRAR